ncbi:MAG: hypothetical protein A4E24_00550 [Methanomethylovorans sp. PtaU1.Bin093]|uniref:hypothetical protein n=1 Tax=Methanomethylovorans sp. PtaU1.Bin093 TaxID=1811679 RepID=UPI0009CC5C9A|nr:hypothetical protein [Methanomethylovorans sp. PtaU1.Bin093]OPY21489.1 MAG: hypothetical protein A4E24_00550 [Methanomethylovorans sp. PtaU1.Bin093]
MSTEAVVDATCNTLSKELKRPNGFSIMLTILMLGVFGHLLQTMPQIPAFIFGKMIYGLVGAVLAFIFGIIGLFITYGFYKLKKIAWTLGLPWLLLEGVNGFLSLFIFPPITVSSLIIIATSSLITAIPALLYILSKKEYFIC